MRVIAFALLTAAGCKKNDRAPPSVLAFPPDATFAPASAHPSVCEVEISGRIVPPKTSKPVPAPLTFVAVGDCLAPDPNIVGYGGSTEGRFFVEVFVPWGSDLTICAASEPAPGEPSRLYGKAPLWMHAEKAGEVEFKDVVIELAPGAPKRFERRVGIPR